MRIELHDNREQEESSLTPVTDLSTGHERVLHPTKGMGLLQKLEYFATYYLPKILGVAVVVAFLIVFLVLIFTRHSDKISILLINHHDSYADAFHAALEDYKESRHYSGKDSIKVNASHNFDLNNPMSVEAKEAFSATLSTREYTLFFANAEVFHQCAEETYFRYLSEYLPQSLQDRFRDDILYGYDDVTDQEYPCGIRLTRENCPFLVNTSYEECCFGVLFSNPQPEEFQDLVEYILTWEAPDEAESAK